MSLFDELLSLIGLSKPKVGLTKKVKITKALNQKARIIDKESKKRAKLRRLVSKVVDVKPYSGVKHKRVTFSATTFCDEARHVCSSTSKFTARNTTDASKDVIAALKQARSTFPNSKLSVFMYPVGGLNYGVESEDNEIDFATTPAWGTGFLEPTTDIDVWWKNRVTPNKDVNEEWKTSSTLKPSLSREPEGTYVPFSHVYIGVLVE